MIRSSLILIITLFLISGCGSSKKSYLSSGEFGGVDERPSRVQTVNRNPWIIWSEGRDHEGKDILDPAILRGDEAIEDGKFSDALKYYRSVKRVGLNRVIDESLVMRITGTLLSMSDPKQALSTISDYYRKRVSGEVEQIPSESSLLLGYSYSNLGNKEQALAWLSQANRVSLPSSATFTRSRDEIVKIIGSIPQPDFENFANVWKADDVISPLIGHERYRRSQGGPSSRVPLKPYTDGNYESYQPPQEQMNPNNPGFKSYVPVAPHDIRVGALLPLSGSLAQLGVSLQQGMMLAFENPEWSNIVKPNIRDSGLDPAYTEQVMSEMNSFEPINAFLGPLMPEHATFAVEWARQQRIPLVAFAKSSDFPVGGSIFRFGTTPDAQIESLLKSIGVKRAKVAIVYPNTPAATELVGLFERLSPAYQLEIVSTHPYEKGDEGALNSIGDKLAKKDIEMIFFPDSIRAAAHFFAGIPEKIRAKITPLGTATWDNLLELQNSGFVLDGAVFPSFYTKYSGNLAADKFYNDYQLRYGKEPDALAALGYDAVSVIVEASKRGAAQGFTLEESLYQTNNFQGITGNISVSSQGEWKRMLPVMRFQQNALSPYVPVETSPIITAPSQPAPVVEQSKEKLPTGDFPF